MIEPDNLRNRYRRYRHAMRAYGWSTHTLDQFRRAYGPTAYSAGAYHLAQTFAECVRGKHPAAWDQDAFDRALAEGRINHYTSREDIARIATRSAR